MLHTGHIQSDLIDECCIEYILTRHIQSDLIDECCIEYILTGHIQPDLIDECCIECILTGHIQSDLIDECCIEYIITGHIQSDFLESRFGWYRQLCGANYYNSVLQFMQAEKTIRMRSLVKMGFSLIDIENIFDSNSDSVTVELDLDGTNLIEYIYNFNFDSHVDIQEQAVLYSIAGYIAHGIMKKGIPCPSCSEMISPGKMLLELDFEMINEPINADEVYAREEFTRLVTRGGLIKPSDLLYVACSHVYTLFDYIKNDEVIKQVLLSTANPRKVFVECFFQKNDEKENVCSLLGTLCSEGHEIRNYIKVAATTLFNIFAKNLVSDENSKINQARKKRSSVSNPKKVSSAGKIKKLQSC